MIKNKIKNIRYFWIVNLFDLVRSFLNKKKRYHIFNFNLFFIFLDFLIIFDKKERKFFKIYFESYFDLLTIRNSFFLEEYNLFRISYIEKKLTKILSEQITKEIDKEILSSLGIEEKKYRRKKSINKILIIIDANPVQPKMK